MNLIEQCSEDVARIEDHFELKAPIDDTLTSSTAETRLTQANNCLEGKAPTLTSWFRLASGRAAGVVFNHPWFRDGSRIRTSLVVAWQEHVMTTKNRTYLLSKSSRTPRTGNIDRKQRSKQQGPAYQRPIIARLS